MGETSLTPCLGHSYIGSDRLGLRIQVLHVLAVSQNTDQRLNDLVVRLELISLLLDVQVSVQRFTQPQPLGDPAQGNEKTMLGGELRVLRTRVRCRTLIMHQLNLRVMR